MRKLSVVWMVGALLMAGCSATWSRYADPEALTVQRPCEPTKSLDIPVKFFNDELPSSQLHAGIGIINTQTEFQEMWALYAKETTALPPIIDFENVALLFVYDPVYYNHVEIIGLNVWQGIANPIIKRTNWTLSIEGDPKMRRIREQKGETLPEPKVNVAFLQVPRHREGRPGVTAILVEGDAEDEGASLVVPVPEEP